MLVFNFSLIVFGFNFGFWTTVCGHLLVAGLQEQLTGSAKTKFTLYLLPNGNRPISHLSEKRIDKIKLFS